MVTVVVAPIVGMRSFAFDAVAPHRTTQKRAYEIGAKELVMHVINGFNGAGFDARGLRGGRQKGNRALAEHLAFVGIGDVTGLAFDA